MENFIPIEKIDEKILIIRGLKIMLDHDLAKLYGVKTYRLNEQVKRNMKKFPDDFMFQLIQEEKDKVIAYCDHLKNIKYSPVLPYVFTEHGAVMVATILNTEIAINVSIQVVRAFNRLRELATTHADLARKINAMENKYDHQFKVVFDAIRELMLPIDKPASRIGFRNRN